MRDIKFRAWNQVAAHQHMIEIEQLVYDEHESLSISGFPFDKGFGGEVFLTDGQFELMQFTGLQDNNGVDIYEGDIVEIYGTGNCIVSITTQLGVCFTNTRDHLSVECAHDVLMENDLGLVIGNTHENPELLESNNVR